MLGTEEHDSIRKIALTCTIIVIGKRMLNLFYVLARILF